MRRGLRLQNPIPDLRSRAERVLASFRPVEPDQSIASPPITQSTSVSIAIGSDIGNAVLAVTHVLIADAPEPILIVPDNRTGSRPNPYAALHLFEGLASRRALASVALSAKTSRTWKHRWQNLAQRVSLAVEPLGDEGWARVSFDGLPTMLEYVDVPLEVTQSGSVIALSSCATGAGCVSLWRDVVHSNSAMRASVGGEASLAELALAVRATYLLTGQVGSLRIAALVEDHVVAELVAFGLYRLREEPTGVEAVGPWEERTVQHLVEIGGGATSASQITLRVVGSAVDDNHHEPLLRLAELLGCRLEHAPA